MIANRLANPACMALESTLRMSGHGCCVFVQSRHAHDSYLSAGRGGRSSFSGVVATVFGGTGFVGHSFTNRLARIGSSIMLPNRAPDHLIRRLKVMSDLGQMLFRDFSLKSSDDELRELVKYSNCVVNLIGSNVPLHHYSLKEVNLDWPLRLASIVAEKNDGTRLLHVTHLNNQLSSARKLSKLMDFDHRAEVGMRKIYPETIIVRSANAFGFNDTYTRFLLHARWKDLAYLGSLPLLYDGGESTFVEPIYVGDLAEAMTRILVHLDAPGQTFEVLGPSRYLLKDLVEYLYAIKQVDCSLRNVLGPLDRSKADFLQGLVKKAFDYNFEKMKNRRLFPLMPLFIDMLTRRETPYEQWTTEDYYNQIHISDYRTGLPGLRELGIEPTPLEDKAYIIHGRYLDATTYEIPTEENFPLKRHRTDVLRIRPQND